MFSRLSEVIITSPAAADFWVYRATAPDVISTFYMHSLNHLVDDLICREMQRVEQ